MQGVPRFGLRTRADYDLLQGLALEGGIQPIGVATLLRHWQGLLAGRFHYVYDRDLSEGESPDGAAPDYIVLTSTDDQSGTTTRRQMQREEFATAEIFRLGFTVTEVEQHITDLEAL